MLGGTNDLAWKAFPTEVIDGLRRTWDVALSRGGKVLALTIPEAGGGHFPEVDAARDEINEAIRTYKRPGLYVVPPFSSTMPSAKAHAGSVLVARQRLQSCTGCFRC